jgi:antirestriction protein ArdC
MATVPTTRKRFADKPTLYQEITDKIIAELEAGCVPWVQPWGSSGSTPRSAYRRTRRPAVNTAASIFSS